ncbi:uncharacterized protein LOC18442513 isoform X2 [Amborella trichopoda]|uniref:uncharacterized protein LOC18442513 isoform X2 n=1 Tax=Amborella trichopoda TaxID=13333 RepID=UPI0009BFB889|nr:uncharacterized protein LOC18442513 isoform X2 [Amborella trichopoda]|eukprot:XP_020528001.1 uncharacterized protein LOC18442513 isoform X2 [Amborella trichopoda]
MDNSWPGKVGPSWPGPPSSVPRNQFEMNADQYFLHTYAQEANVSNTMNFGSTPYNCKMANPEFANSFISLLAGGPSQQICGEFQQLTSSRSGMATTSPPINENIVNGPELYQVIGSRNPLAFNSGRGLVFNDGNLQPKSSHLHGSNAAKQVFSDHTPRDNEIVSQRSPIQWLIGTTNTKQQNNAHISSYTRFKLPSDSKCDVIDQASSIVKGLTRAYCLGKSGDLLLIEGGHLGIVCSCHGLHMSVAKFCEHSGSSVINPGEAVRTGSGETVAQWRRENYIKLGIKLPDDTAGWDWPDGSTANAGKPKYKSACIQKNQNIEKNSGVSRHGYPFDGQPRSEQPWNNANSFNYPRGGLAILESSASRTTEIVRPKDGDNSNLTSPSSMPAFVSNHTTHALNDTLPGPKVTRASLDKGSEHCEYQSIVDYIEFISKGGNPFVTNQRSTNLKSFNGGSTARRCNRTREVFMLDKDAMASNIELRLGQPSQQSQARNCSLPSSIRSQSFNAIGDQKSLFCEQLIQRASGSRITEESRQNFLRPSDLSAMKEREKESRLNSVNPVNRSTHVGEPGIVNLLEGHMSKNSIMSMLLSPMENFGTNEEGLMLQPNSNMAPEHLVPKLIHSNSQLLKSGTNCFTTNKSEMMERKLANHIDAVKMSRDMPNGSSTFSSIGSTVHVKQTGDSLLHGISVGHGNHSNSVMLGGQSPANLPHPAIILSAEPDVRNTSDHFVKPSCNANANANPDSFFHRADDSAASTGSSVMPVNFSGWNPIYLSNLTTILPNGDLTGLRHQVSDENLRAPTLRSLPQVSKQDNKAATPCMNLDQGQFYCHSTVQLPNDYSQQERFGPEPKQGPVLNGNQDTTEEQDKTTRFCCKGLLDGGREKLSCLTGPNNYCKCCNLTTAPSISLQPRGIDVHSSHCHQNCCVEQPLLRLASRSNHHNNCCVKHARCNQAEPNPCVCSNFWCAEHLKSFAGSCSSRMGAHAEGSLKENNGNTAVDKTSLLLPPSIDDGFRSSLDKTTELKRCENLETLDIVKRSCNTMQWRDVPGKIMDSSATTDIERPAKMMCRARNEDQLADTASKRFDEGCQDAGSLKEQQMSNVCSESSAAVVTEFSGRCFVNLDLGSTRSTCDEIVDEGSGIEKCCSSDAHNAGMWAETANLSGNTDAVLGRSSTLPSHSTDPINNLKVRSSLRLKKVRLPFGSPKGENAVHKKQVGGAFKIERKRKTMKWKKLDASLSGSGTDDRQYELVNRSKCSAMCVYPEVEKSSHADLGPTKSSCFCTIATLGPKRKRSTLTSSRPLNLVGDACTLDGPSRKYIDSGQGRVLQVPIFPKEWKNNREMTKDKDKSGVQHGGEDPNVQEVQKYSKMGLGKSISALPNNYCNDQKARPIVCGNLGIIANVNSAEGLQKAAKVVSLSSILRRAKRCTNENQEMRFSSMSETQNKFSNRSQGCHTTPCAASRVKDKEGHDSVETSAADWFSAIQMHQTANAVKEVRKYSLNELTQKGKHANKQACLNHLSRQEHLQSREKNLCPRSATQNDKLVDNLNEKQSRTPNSCTRKNSICMQRSVFRTSEKLCLENVKETQGPIDVSHEVKGKKSSTKCRKRKAFILDSDVFCCVCGGSDKDDFNCILECSQCLIKVHQACYGVLKAPKGRWCCRPCRADIKDIVCVLCGYSGGAMTRALRSRNIVKNLLQTWKIKKGRKSLDPFHLSDSKHDDLNGLSGKLGGGPSRLEKMDSISAMKPGTLERVSRVMMKANTLDATSIMRNADILVDDFQVHNTITAAVLDPNVTQWLHMVCGLWMPGTRCPNVDTMSAFDVSGVSPPKRNTVCSICKRPGGSCIRCRVADCSVFFHPWCAHQKGLLQSEIEGVDNENVGFYGRCLFHAVNINCLTKPVHLVNDKVEDHSDNKDPTCARTEGYKGRKKEGLHYGLRGQSKDNSGCLVPQEQINAWLHINGQKSCTRGLIKPPASDTEYDCRKEYARYKQSKGWKQLVVYKSGIHALGLYTSQFIFRGAMVVEYVGEIVGLRVADKREAEYHSGRRIQYESACYFFRIDKEHIIDATRKGGIARFVNHSCLPNCVAKVITIRNEKKVVFFAERDINPGEEITYDYHFNNEDEGKKIPCFCNSKNCRRFLN